MVLDVKNATCTLDASLCREIHESLFLFLDAAIVGPIKRCSGPSFITLGMQGTLRLWMLALLGATTVVTPRECWLSTLGVLHPGVPVMWQTHIRDPSPTAGSCKGGRFPNVTRLHWLCVSAGVRQ